MRSNDVIDLQWLQKASNGNMSKAKYVIYLPQVRHSPSRRPVGFIVCYMAGIPHAPREPTLVNIPHWIVLSPISRAIT